jgi:hypothetical protein
LKLQVEYSKLHIRELFLHATELTSTIADSIIEYSTLSGIVLPSTDRGIISLGILVYGNMSVIFIF